MSLAISKHPSRVEAVSDHDAEKSEIFIDKKADIGLQYLAQNERIEFTVDEERKVRWKIDLFLLPIVRMPISLSYHWSSANPYLTSSLLRLVSNTWTKSQYPTLLSMG